MSRQNWYILVVGIILIGNSAQILGHIAIRKSDRYQVAVHDGWQDFCGGSIISDKYIISAAKCFKDNDGTILGPLYVFAASTKFVNAGTGAAIEDIYVPQMFSCLDDHCHPADIAVLKLKGRLRLEADLGISPINLPKPISESEYDMYEFKTAVASGYCPHPSELISLDQPSFIPDKQRYYPGELEIVKVDVLQQNECEYAWLGVTKIFSTQMCAKGRGTSTLSPGICSDYPGYGLVYNNTLIGIASYGAEICSKNDDCTLYPIVYTRVDSYLWFIEDAMKDIEYFHVRRFKINKYNDYSRGADIRHTSFIIKYLIFLITVFKL